MMGTPNGSWDSDLRLSYLHMESYGGCYVHMTLMQAHTYRCSQESEPLMPLRMRKREIVCLAATAQAVQT